MFFCVLKEDWLILQLQNDSDTKTYVDSLYNSNIKDKENINFNTYQNIITEIYLILNKKLFNCVI